MFLLWVGEQETALTGFLVQQCVSGQHVAVCRWVECVCVCVVVGLEQAEGIHRGVVGPRLYSDNN